PLLYVPSESDARADAGNVPYSMHEDTTPRRRRKKSGWWKGSVLALAVLVLAGIFAVTYWDRTVALLPPPPAEPAKMVKNTKPPAEPQIMDKNTKQPTTTAKETPVPVKPKANDPPPKNDPPKKDPSKPPPKPPPPPNTSAELG